MKSLLTALLLLYLTTQALSRTAPEHLTLEDFNHDDKFYEYEVEAMNRIYAEMEADFEAEQSTLLDETNSTTITPITRLFAKNLPLMLVVQWPIVFGKENPSKANKHKIAAFTSWTIHGLWPQGPNSVNCNSKYKYNDHDLTTIRHNLEVSWPNLAKFKGPKNKEDSSFWEYQWRKHGTCSEMKLHDFFNKAHDLWTRYSVTDLLSQANIAPHDSHLYSKADFEKAFHSQIGARQFILRCTKSNWLKEIFICFDHLGKKLINCPSTAKTNCPQKVHYMKTM